MAPQQSHYSLRWKNHQSHILSEFDALLQAETLVDVTLVCSEISVRAHKVVLSACSPFFQKIFAENPCKHPVIVLKDFQGWIIQAIVDFMYKGEISVDHEQLPFLIKAADNLQIRGLSLNENDYVCRKKVSSFNQRELTDLSGQTDEGNNDDVDVDENEEVDRLLLNGSCSFMDSFTNRAKFSPSLNLPRRKQTKPRRRSTEQNVQDLSLGKGKVVPDQPENLSMKKELPISADEVQKSSKPQTPESLVSTEIESNVTSDKFDLLSPPQSNLPTSHSMISNHLSADFNGYKSPLPFTQLPSTSSSLSLPSPTYFGLDAALNLYTPPLIDNYRSNIFDLPELKSTIDQTPLYMKKKIGRPKGQHSAPRGGPPRSWTNAELTQALQHVWNRKLTTSQASRLFGIPYNSLLMYVRGKYGKSLKLEQLRNNCMGAQNTNSSDLLSTLNNNNSLTSNNNNNNISNNNNNNNSNNNNNNGTILKPEKQFDSIVQSTRTPSISEDIHNSIFNPFMTNIFSDFTNSNYPMSLNMLNYLPPKTEKASEFNFNLNLTDSCLATNNESLILPHENNNTSNSNKSVIKEEIYTTSI